MKTAVVLLGVILILAGFVLVAYKVEIITGYETEMEYQWVPPEEVESMKEEGWVELLSEPLSPYQQRQRRSLERSTAGYQPGYVFMEREILWEYYIEVYPYQTIGIIVLLIGLVTSIIGFYIPSISEVAETEVEGEAGQARLDEFAEVSERETD